uniref:Uncharacterized protein n=1 Tax=Arundo donax TaxID=35708 RepID=A0A0A9AXQ7_ARUDO
MSSTVVHSSRIKSTNKHVELKQCTSAKSSTLYHVHLPHS